MRVLTKEGKELEENFLLNYSGSGCTCFISPPCGHCIHPGHPLNLEATDDLWEEDTTEERADDVMKAIRQSCGKF